MTLIQQAFGVLLLALALLLVYLLQPILAPFLAGIILAYLGDPLVDRLEAWGLGRTLGVFIVFLVFLGLLAAILLVILPLVFRELGAFIRDLPGYIAWLQETTSPWLLATFGVDPFDIKLDMLANQLKQNWQKAGGLAGELLAQVTASSFALLTAIASIGLTPGVAFYLMRDWDLIVAHIREIIPGKWQATSVQLAGECDEVLGAFLRGQLMIMLLLGLIYSVGLYIAGLKLALLIGTLAGLASIVPYLGLIVGIAAAGLAALFQFQDFLHLFYVALVFGVGQALEATVLTPWLVGDKIGLHPVAVIFAILAGGQLFGFVGVLLALPVAAIIMVIMRYLHTSYLRREYYEQDKKS